MDEEGKSQAAINKNKVMLLEKLEKLKDKVKNKNIVFYKEYMAKRIISEQLIRHKRNIRILGIVVPEKSIQDPFLYESYMKISRHHRSLTLIENEKILEPEKHSLFDFEDRVGNAEQLINTVKDKALLQESVQESIEGLALQKQETMEMDGINPLLNTLAGRGGMQGGPKSDSSDIVSLDDELKLELKEKDKKSNFSLLGALKPQNVGSFEFVYNNNDALTEKAALFTRSLRPKPVKVFNKSLMIRKGKYSKQGKLNLNACKFDAIISRDYMCTFYDNNVVLKLYAELEFFFKNIFYDNIDKIMEEIGYDSPQFELIYNTRYQRTNFNQHYSLPEENSTLKDTNLVLGMKSQQEGASPSFFEEGVFLKKDSKFQEAEVRKELEDMSFLKHVIPQNIIISQSKDRSGEGATSNIPNSAKKASQSSKDRLLILLIGDKNRGIISGLLKVVYEDLKSFDNCAVSTLSIKFTVEVMEPSKKVKRKCPSLI